MPASSDQASDIATPQWQHQEHVLRAAAGSGRAEPETFAEFARLLEASGSPDQAIAWLKRVLREQPGHCLAWLALGQIFSQQGAGPSAVRCFETVSALVKDDPKAMRLLGETALAYGHWEIARRCYDGAQDPDAQLARYRIAAETGQQTWALRQALMADPALRARLLDEGCNVSKGGFAIRL